MNFNDYWKRCEQATHAALEKRLPAPDQDPTTLHQAMRYVTLNGGKRFRAILVIMTGEMLNVDLKPLLAPATAVECLHAYSLVHDDLPCMDDDDFRRGKPSCHVAYDEATAVLVGDALQSLAFEILSSDEDLINFHDKKSDLIATLARAAGSQGMVGGQMMDIQLEKSGKILDHLEQVHRLKTAKLIQCAVMMGGLLSDEINDQVLECLGNYGESLGLAFQYTDDYLDEEHQQGRLNEKARLHADNAVDAVRMLDWNTSSLQRMANFVVERTN